MWLLTSFVRCVCSSLSLRLWLYAELGCFGEADVLYHLVELFAWVELDLFDFDGLEGFFVVKACECFHGLGVEGGFEGTEIAHLDSVADFHVVDESVGECVDDCFGGSCVDAA